MSTIFWSNSTLVVNLPTSIFSPSTFTYPDFTPSCILSLKALTIGFNSLTASLLTPSFLFLWVRKSKSNFCIDKTPVFESTVARTSNISAICFKKFWTGTL